MTVEISDIVEKDVDEAAKTTEECMNDAWERWEEGYYPREALEFDLTRHTNEEYRKHLEIPGSFFFAAKEEDKITGLALGRAMGKSGLATLGWICVKPEFRRRGIGESMLQHVEGHVKEKGCHKISAFTLPCLTDAVRLYFRRGWVPECNLKRHWWKVDFMVMSKWLD